MDRLIFFIFSSIIIAFLLGLVCKDKRALLVWMFIIVLLILSAVYLFQFGHLGAFSFKAFQAEASFVKEQRQEVERDVKEIDNIKEEIEAILDDAKLMKDAIVQLRELAMPPILLFEGSEIHKNDKNYTALVQFKPSKNAGLGILEFKVTIAGGNSEIIDFEPSTKYHSYTGGVPNIADDKQSAELKFAILGGAGYPTLEIAISNPALLEITGNMLKEPVEIEVK